MAQHGYRYLSSNYVNRFIDGNILFRPLSYFINHEQDGVRGDAFDGTRVCAPTDGLEANSDHGNFLIHSFKSTVVDPDSIFVMCCSRKFSPDLAKCFKANTCIEFNLYQFRRKLFDAVRLRLPGYSLLYQNVDYYSPEDQMGTDWAFPGSIVFQKLRDKFGYQKEYRFAFGPSESLIFDYSAKNLKITAEFGPSNPPAVLYGPCQEINLQIGDISKFCKILSF